MPEPHRWVDLFHHRWTVPLLAQLHASAGSKFVTMVNRLGVNRGALRQPLDAAIAHGWIVRNPGYGHPLRPEYLLSESGAEAAAGCHALFELLRRRGLESVMLRKWSAAVLHTAGRGCRRFAEFKSALPGLTDRALALTLKQLSAAKMLKRRVRDAYPPVAEYSLATGARRLVKILDRL